MDTNQTFLDLCQSAALTAEKTVDKVWGQEFHVVNNDLFCLKYLVFPKGGKISKHRHLKKTELFTCAIGYFGMEIIKDGVSKKSIFKTGDKILLEPGTWHQLEAFADSIILEVSTHDDPADNERLEMSSFNSSNAKNIKNYE